MPNVKTSRRDKAAATRRAITRAAHAEFVEHGFQGATIAAIAARAGVATQTVYFVFHTKPELMSAVIDAAVMGEDDPVPPQSTPWWKAMVAEPDARVAPRLFLAGVGPLFERSATLGEVLRAAALTDPEVNRTHEMHDNMRRIAFGQVLEVLETKATLRSDRTRQQLVDVSSSSAATPSITCMPSSTVGPATRSSTGGPTLSPGCAPRALSSLLRARAWIRASRGSPRPSSLR